MEMPLIPSEVPGEVWGANPAKHAALLMAPQFSENALAEGMGNVLPAQRAGQQQSQHLLSLLVNKPQEAKGAWLVPSCLSDGI